jgi:hypothetical protein
MKTDQKMRHRGTEAQRRARKPSAASVSLCLCGRFILLLLAVTLISCSSQPPAMEAQSRDTKTGTVAHVVLCWLKAPGEENGRRKIIAASNTFKQIPGVLSVTAGPALPSTRPIVDSSFDVGVVILFKDRESLRAYDTHPIHKEAVEKVLRPLAGKIQVYDVEQ